MLRPFNMSAERGALTTVLGAMEAVVEPAAYFGARGLTQLAGPPKLRRHAVRARRDEDVERLWKVSEGLTGCARRLITSLGLLRWTRAHPIEGAWLVATAVGSLRARSIRSSRWAGWAHRPSTAPSSTEGST